MATVTINDTHLNDIAGAIRTKNGTSTKYKPSEMASAISAITTSENLDTELTQQNTLLSTQTVTVNDIKTALEGKGSATPTKTMKISANGTYDVTNYATAMVNVDFSDMEDRLVNNSLRGSYENDRLTYLNGYSFAYNAYLETLSLPNVKSMGQYSLYHCESLQELNVPSLTTVYGNAFEYCGLEHIYLPEVTTVYGSTFSMVVYTKTITLPKLKKITNSRFLDIANQLTRIDFGSLEEITDKSTVFGQTPSLTEIIIRTPSVCELAERNYDLWSYNMNPNVYVPDNLVNSYKAHSVWSQYAANIKPISELEG